MGTAVQDDALGNTSRQFERSLRKERKEETRFVDAMPKHSFCGLEAQTSTRMNLCPIQIQVFGERHRLNFGLQGGGEEEKCPPSEWRKESFGTFEKFFGYLRHGLKAKQESLFLCLLRAILSSLLLLLPSHCHSTSNRNDISKLPKTPKRFRDAWQDELFKLEGTAVWTSNVHSCNWQLPVTWSLKLCNLQTSSSRLDLLSYIAHKSSGTKDLRDLKALLLLIFWFHVKFRSCLCHFQVYVSRILNFPPCQPR